MADNFDDIDKLQEKVLEGYSEKLKREFLSPKNVGRLDDSDSWSRVTGLCVDTVEMFLKVENDEIKDIGFLTDGCGFTIVCCSYLTREVKGKSLAEAYQVEPEKIDEYFGGLPEENKHCANLAVATLRAAIDKYDKIRSLDI
jgi:nitrogen fixation NifU-like protein